MAEQGEGAEGEFITSCWNGLRLYVQKWMPDGPPSALVYLCHGVGEYMGRYEKLGEHLCSKGILAFGHDHVGHGRSEGDRVDVNSIDTYAVDVMTHVEQVKAEYPDTPCILLGHSMGGTVACLLTMMKPDLFVGLVLSAPAVEVDPKLAGTCMRLLARAVATMFPQMGLLQLDPDLISSIPEEVRMYDQDPLVYHGALKARWGVAMMQAIEHIQQHLSEIVLPLCIMHGSADGIVPASACELVRDNASSEDKTYKIFEDNRHEVLHDKSQEEARVFISDWILAHLK